MSRKPQPISIWQPEQADGKLVFVRPQPPAYGDHYATELTLRADHQKGFTRVCFFGESVAAGYLYAPHLTPAQVLAERLNEASDQDRFEVIDLARTNETLTGLADTVAASMQLTPDVLVLFVGNNWNLLETPDISPYTPHAEARSIYATALDKHGLEGVMRLAVTRLQQKATAAFAQIAACTGQRNIPVVVLIPEVNLCDWPARQPPAQLSPQDTEAWFTRYRQGRHALSCASWQEAVTAGLDLLALDDGTCPSTFRLLGDAWRISGQADKAENAYRAEIDSENYASLCFLGSPRVTTQATQFLKRASARYGWTCVDLPKIFAAHTGSPLTDRRLFLDYCHLTLEGIGLAMQAAASAILKPENTETPIKPPPLPGMTPENEAIAHFGAAIHTAHRLPDSASKGELLDYWLRKALAASEGIQTAMLDLFEARATSLPALLTPAQARNSASPYRLLIQHGWKYAYCDVQLLQSMIRVLGAHGSLGQRMRQSLIAGRGINTGTELIHPPHHLWEPLERFYPEVMHATPRTAFHRCPWPETGFSLICDNSHDLHLDVVLRLPANGTVQLAVANTPFADFQAETSWRKFEAIIPKKLLAAGANRLAIRWPSTGSGRDNRRLLAGEPADIFPFFGEIFSLIART